MNFCVMNDNKIWQDRTILLWYMAIGSFAVKSAVYQYPPSSSHEQCKDGVEGIGG